MNYEQKLNVYLTHIEQRLFLKDRRTDKNFKCFLTRASFNIEDVKNMLTYILIKYICSSQTERYSTAINLIDTVVLMSCTNVNELGKFFEVIENTKNKICNFKFFFAKSSNLQIQLSQFLRKFNKEVLDGDEYINNVFEFFCTHNVFLSNIRIRQSDIMPKKIKLNWLIFENPNDFASIDTFIFEQNSSVLKTMFLLNYLLLNHFEKSFIFDKNLISELEKYYIKIWYSVNIQKALDKDPTILHQYFIIIDKHKTLIQKNETIRIDLQQFFEQYNFAKFQAEGLDEYYSMIKQQFFAQNPITYDRIMSKAIKSARF